MQANNVSDVECAVLEDVTCCKYGYITAVFCAQGDASYGQRSAVHTVQYLDLDHGASASASADSEHETTRFTFATADTTDYKEIDPLKTKALQVTRCEVENKRRRSSDKLMEV